MFPYIISNLLVCIISLILGIFVLVKNRKETINRIWFIINIAIVIWTFSSVQTVSAKDELSGLFWGRFLYVGALFIPSLFLHFTEVLINK